jgi:tetratricopeptide (TPR) repeat protein
MLADPQFLMSSAQIVQEHRHELAYLADLIGWRLKLREQKENEWNEDNPFYWRFSLQGGGVPPDTEEQAAGYYARGEYEKAEAIFRLLIDSFEGYAEGYNYLGLIAYQQSKLEEAMGHFKKTIELGRKLFPARIPKKGYWRDLATRPYMRGLRNLAMTLNEAGRYDEALDVCQRLDSECDDGLMADSQRAAIHLNTRRWREAFELARGSGGEWDPSAGFVEAFALFEAGRSQEVLPVYLFASLHYPRAARLLLREKLIAPKSHEEARDHNAGVGLLRSLHAYLAKQSQPAKRFFRGLTRDPRVAKLLQESATAERLWQGARDDRSTFERLTLLRSRDFAAREAQRLSDLLPHAGERGAAIH